MSNSIARCLLASALILTPAAFAAPSTHVRIETGGQLATACQAYLAQRAQEAENVLAPADPCRAYLTGFASAYGIGQSKALETRVTGAAPTPPPPPSYKMGQWTKPGAGVTAEGTSMPKEEPMACFVLPPYLSYREFAELIVAFLPAHTDYATKPAYITAAAALAEKYPCK